MSCPTVIHEIRRNSKPDGTYVRKYVQSKCEARKHGSKGNHRKPEDLWWRVDHMIEDEDWSPSQIAGVLRREGIHIMKQTIYNHAHAGTTGKLASHMPHRLKYTKRSKALRPTKATNIPNRIGIHQRPMQVDDTRFGNWELDTTVDSYGHATVTLTGRSTNYILMEGLPQGWEALPMAKTVAKLSFPYRESLPTITTDNGYEFAVHEEITRRLSMNGRSPVVVYFTDSHSS